MQTPPVWFEYSTFLGSYAGWREAAACSFDYLSLSASLLVPFLSPGSGGGGGEEGNLGFWKNKQTNNLHNF